MFWFSIFLVWLCIPAQAMTMEDPAVFTVIALCSFIACVLFVLVVVLIGLICTYNCYGNFPRLTFDWMRAKRGGEAIPDTLTFSVDRHTAAMLEQLYSDSDEEKPEIPVKHNAPIYCEPSDEAQTETVNSPETRTFSVDRHTHEVPPQSGTSNGQMTPMDTHVISFDRQTHDFLQQIYDDTDSSENSTTADHYYQGNSSGEEEAQTPHEQGHHAEQANVYQPLLVYENLREATGYQDIQKVRDDSDTSSYEFVDDFLHGEAGVKGEDMDRQGAM